MKSGVYKMYWDNNPKFYFGSSKDIKGRIFRHLSHIRNGSHRNPSVQKALSEFCEELGVSYFAVECRKRRYKMSYQDAFDYYIKR